MNERDEEWGIVTARMELLTQDEEIVVVDNHKLLVATENNTALDR